MSFPRYLVHHQVNVTQRDSLDFVSSSILPDIEPASGNLMWNAAASDYKTPQYIQSSRPSLGNHPDLRNTAIRILGVFEGFEQNFGASGQSATDTKYCPCFMV